MMGSAQLDFVPLEDTAALAEEARPSALRQQVAERLASHRQRRERSQAIEEVSARTSKARPAGPRHRAAAAVAERYAQTPTYRTFLAEQARLAIQQAAAAAEVAMRNAEAVAVAQQELLGELELWNTPQEFTAETAIQITREEPAPRKVDTSRSKPLERPVGLTVRLYEDLRQVPPASRQAATPRPRPGLRTAEPDAEESRALDAEIAFRQAPVFEDFWTEAEPPVPLPANLLEFPRQLIATRKARPRLAEGPLREEITPRTAQLRIFEVEPGQISTAPATASSAGHDWNIHLDAHTVTELQINPDAPPMPVLASLLPPQTAPMGLRSMAAMVDGILVAGAVLAFVAMFARFAGDIPLGLPAVLGLAGLLAVFHLLYQFLFFTLSDQTPGMRYARIGLCTFSDENPSRAAMRRRVLAQMVAVCPLGLGVLWMLLDDDGLGWHDRLSRMYQRAY